MASTLECITSSSAPLHAPCLLGREHTTLSRTLAVCLPRRNARRPRRFSTSASHESAMVPAVESAPSGPAMITLKFVGPADAEVAEFSLESGTKNLRRAMLDAKVPLYDMYGSVMNCGGGGSCGTCLVDVKEGAELFSDRTDTEDRYLKKRPETWRLACQTIVGDKTNSGKVVIRTLPQKK